MFVALTLANECWSYGRRGITDRTDHLSEPADSI